MTVVGSMADLLRAFDLLLLGIALVYASMTLVFYWQFNRAVTADPRTPDGSRLAKHVYRISAAHIGLMLVMGMQLVSSLGDPLEWWRAPVLTPILLLTVNALHNMLMLQRGRKRPSRLEGEPRDPRLPGDPRDERLSGDPRDERNHYESEKPDPRDERRLSDAPDKHDPREKRSAPEAAIPDRRDPRRVGDPPVDEIV